MREPGVYYFDLTMAESADRRRVHGESCCLMMARLNGMDLKRSNHYYHWYNNCRCCICGGPLNKPAREAIHE